MRSIAGEFSPCRQRQRGDRLTSSPTEMEALLPAPDQSTWIGRRIAPSCFSPCRRACASRNWSTSIAVTSRSERARISVARARDETALHTDDAGQSRTLEAWLKERTGNDDAPVFPTIRGKRLSRDAVEHIVRKYALAASKACASLTGKRISPHVLRHSTAMDLLPSGVDRTVIALWLGHESVETTQVYIHADLRLKEKALARVASTIAQPGRYKPDDALLTFLESL